jgi:hypothetical protein
MLKVELAYWINERYRIKLAKDAQCTPPWSTDKVFQTVRFCNVHREDDRVTRWLRTHWNRPGDPAWRYVVGRLINWPDSLAEVINCDYPWQMKDTLKRRRDLGGKVFTSAYTVSTCGRRMDKLDYVFDHVAPRAMAAQAAGEPTTLEDAHFWLSNVDGLGSFLAAQVVADMKNTRGHLLQQAPDWWTWSAPGPGSLRGLAWFFHKDPELISPRTYVADFDLCRQEVDPLVNPEVPRISAQDFQNCLCEFSKWCKVSYDNGHVRNKYDAFLSASRAVQPAVQHAGARHPADGKWVALAAVQSDAA